MEIEIEVIGKTNRWLVNQSPIRIGRGTSCEVTLPARQFPHVALVHAELEMVNGALRLAAADSSEGPVSLNGQPVEAGAYILSGDILQLGPQGPQLGVQYREAAAPARTSYEPTRVMQVADVPGRDATRTMPAPNNSGRVPTQVMSTPTQKPEVSGRTPTQVMSVAIPPESSRQAPPPLSPRAPQKGTFGDAPPQSPAKPVPNPLMRVPAAPPAQGQATMDMSPIVKSLRTMQILVVASLLVVVILAVLVIRLQSQVSSDHDELMALRSQNANAVSQLTPALDARLNVFSQRMDSIDATMQAGEARMEHGMEVKMKAAQDQLFASLDTRMKSTEDHMVNRMNTELPPLLDKYVSAKMAEMKH